MTFSFNHIYAITYLSTSQYLNVFIQTKDERERVAKSKGVCSTCAKQTHRITPFRSIPLGKKILRFCVMYDI